MTDMISATYDQFWRERGAQDPQAVLAEPAPSASADEWRRFVSACSLQMLVAGCVTYRPFADGATP